MELRTRRDTSETTVRKDEEEEEEEQPLSPAARVFHSPEFNCYVIAVIGIKKKIEPDVIIEGLRQTLIRHPRFSGILVSLTLTYIHIYRYTYVYIFLKRIIISVLQ